uniref:Uncharacterized protein n=1 Tax=Grammatophora oceanica TaxID=210454 RepID=A0A7S1VL00_9STRA
MVVSSITPGGSTRATNLSPILSVSFVVLEPSTRTSHVPSRFRLINLLSTVYPVMSTHSKAQTVTAAAIASSPEMNANQIVTQCLERSRSSITPLSQPLKHT